MSTIVERIPGLSGKRDENDRESERGFALPSMILLVTILSMVGLSVILLKYLEQTEVLLEIARRKADDAANNGIVRLLEKTQNLRQLESSPNAVFDFDDGSKATASLRPWGVFAAAISAGEFRHVLSRKAVLVGDTSPETMRSALYFANTSHQLILAGSTTIAGDVLTGGRGISTGSLPGIAKPGQNPVQGAVRNLDVSQMPIYPPSRLLKYVANVKARFSSPKGAVLRLSIPGQITISTSMIPDTLDAIAVAGNVVWKARVNRSDRPLSVLVRGSLEVTSESAVSGLVEISATDSITVSSGASLVNCIFYSPRSVRVESGSRGAYQLIAPNITLGNGVRMEYPSAVVLLLDENSGATPLMLSSGSSVDGAVLALNPKGIVQKASTVVMDGSSIVTGLFYAEGTVTLDGSVFGSSCVRDFYFFMKPTRYYGWLRTAHLSRKNLPAGFLLPPGFANELHLKILDWL